MSLSFVFYNDCGRCRSIYKTSEKTFLNFLVTLLCFSCYCFLQYIYFFGIPSVSCQWKMRSLKQISKQHRLRDVTTSWVGIGTLELTFRVQNIWVWEDLYCLTAVLQLQRLHYTKGNHFEGGYQSLLGGEWQVIRSSPKSPTTKKNCCGEAGPVVGFAHQKLSANSRHQSSALQTPRVTHLKKKNTEKCNSCCERSHKYY